jgi:hypothetical protein
MSLRTVATKFAMCNLLLSGLMLPPPAQPAAQVEKAHPEHFTRMARTGSRQCKRDCVVAYSQCLALHADSCSRKYSWCLNSC